MGRVRTLAECLWLPALFLAGILGCYTVAFHHATPHDVKVAVAAPASATARMQRGFDAASPGAFQLDAVHGASAALDKVRQEDAVAAVVPKGRVIQLYGAKADGASLENIVLNAFTNAAKKSGDKVQFHELVPTVAGDTLGTSVMYLAMGGTLPAYFAVMGMQRAVGFRRRGLVVVFVVSAAVIAAIEYVVATYGLHTIPQHAASLGVMMLLTEAVALTGYGLVPFFGRFFPGVAVTVFMMLGMPTSGGAVPVDLVPGFFRFLHPILPMGNVVDALRSVSYFDDHKVTRPLLVLSAWLVGGVLLIALGAWKQSRAARREEAPELPVEDPTIEMPETVGLVPHRHRFGEPGAVLVGRVQDEWGRPLADAVLTVTTSQGRELVRARTDRNGEYAVAGVPEGYTLVMASSAGRQPTVNWVLIDHSRVAELDFRLELRQWRPVVV
jgi:hypothetical protein